MVEGRMDEHAKAQRRDMRVLLRKSCAVLAVTLPQWVCAPGLPVAIFAVSRPPRAHIVP